MRTNLRLCNNFVFLKIRKKKMRRNVQNLFRFMRKRCAKVHQKRICAKIKQILRNKYGFFVETLVPFQENKKRIEMFCFNEKMLMKNFLLHISLEPLLCMIDGTAD